MSDDTDNQNELEAQGYYDEISIDGEDFELGPSLLGTEQNTAWHDDPDVARDMRDDR